MKLNIVDKFRKQLPADPILENSRRQVSGACFSYVTPNAEISPKLLHVSPELLSNLGLTQEDAKTEAFLNFVTGKHVLKDTKPYAMCYGGHQFGNWAGQLGDGRAINLCEVEHDAKNWALQLKGAGETPYSRSADGLAVLRSSIREYLCSESMYHLGVPTTRALSIALSGNEVLRDVMYNGNAAYEKGAIVCRAAASFLRFGNYQILAAQGDVTTLKTLVDYTITNHFSHIGTPSKQTYLTFFEAVAKRTLKMIIHWQRVGFVHGVMNTDNMSILGLTIDYGPYGWLEGYDNGWTPNTTDNAHKRYRYGNQGNIGLWNLLQLANALYLLIEEPEPLEAILMAYKTNYDTAHLEMMCSKLGLANRQNEDEDLVKNLEEVLHLTETDMTLFFRNLSHFKKEMLEVEGLKIIKEAFYNEKDVVDTIKTRWLEWFKAYKIRLAKETQTHDVRAREMNLVNPKYVLRNYMAQLAIEDAEHNNYKLLDELYTMLKTPYSDNPKYEKWYAKRPEWARHKVGCSMLSCSS